MNKCLKDFNYCIMYPTNSPIQIFECDKCLKDLDEMGWEDAYAAFGDCSCPTTEPGDDIFHIVRKALNESSFASKRRRKTRGFCKFCMSVNHHSSTCQNRDGLDRNYVRSDKRAKMNDRKTRDMKVKKSRKGKGSWIKTEW